MHPSDKITEQSEESSYFEKRPRRDYELLADQENMSLIDQEDEYVIVDPITEQYRANNMGAAATRGRSFVEESLARERLTQNRAKGQPTGKEPATNVLASGTQMTESSETENEDNGVAGNGEGEDR